MKVIKTALSYLRTRSVTILTALIIWVTCIVIYFAYSLPSEPILYAMLLAGVLLLPIFVIDVIAFVKKHRELTVLRENGIYSLEHLPYALGTVERDYQETLRALFEQKRRMESDNDLKRLEQEDYYSMWVHQIKTPIAAIRLMLQPDSHYSKINGELFQIEQYVDMALNFIRIESINNDLELKSHKLDDIIGKALKKYSRIFILKKMSLSFTQTEQTVLTDEKWLCFVIEQLISNALKYSAPKGSVKIYSKSPFTLTIEDEGIGIRPEDLPRIFEKGFTGYNGRQDKKSSGIGLYMCDKVLKTLSHKISIESVPGRGTKVIIGLETVKIRHE